MTDAATDGLAGESDASPEEIATYYDAWASAQYDDDVEGWGYEAPERVAELLATHHTNAESSPLILDAGCGTGKVGAALSQQGFSALIGGDFTPASVEAARQRGLYQSVDHLDLNDRLPFDDDAFAAVVSVGVFSYLADTAATIGEFLRVTQPGGLVIFTQRTDLWEPRGCTAIIESFVEAGACAATMSEPSPYLPGHPEFANDIGIIYTSLLVS